MAVRLWSSRVANCLKTSLFQRGFTSVVKDLKCHVHEGKKLGGSLDVKAMSTGHFSGKYDESQVDEQMKKLLGGGNSSRKKKKRTVLRIFRYQGEDEIWTVGTNIYLINEEEEDDKEEDGDTSEERWIDKESIGNFFGKRRLVGCIRYKIDTEKITISDVETFEAISKYEE